MPWPPQWGKAFLPPFTTSFFHDAWTALPIHLLQRQAIVRVAVHGFQLDTLLVRRSPAAVVVVVVAIFGVAAAAFVVGQRVVKGGIHVLSSHHAVLTLVEAVPRKAARPQAHTNQHHHCRQQQRVQDWVVAERFTEAAREGATGLFVAGAGGNGGGRGTC